MSLAVPGMRERGAGIVVNVASMAGLVPLRGASYYGAAKAGLAMASEIARIELARAACSVVTVYPGPVRWGSRAGPAPRSGASRPRPVDADRRGGALADRVIEALDRGQPAGHLSVAVCLAAGALRASRFVTEHLSPEPVHRRIGSPTFPPAGREDDTLKAVVLRAAAGRRPFRGERHVDDSSQLLGARPRRPRLRAARGLVRARRGRRSGRRNPRPEGRSDGPFQRGEEGGRRAELGEGRARAARFARHHRQPQRPPGALACASRRRQAQRRVDRVRLAPSTRR